MAELLLVLVLADAPSCERMEELKYFEDISRISRHWFKIIAMLSLFPIINPIIKSSAVRMLERPFDHTVLSFHVGELRKI